MSDKKQLAAVPTGNWGANGVNFAVEENGVKIEFDCAEGEIKQKLLVDGQGRFSLIGIYTALVGGAARIDESVKPQAARFEGQISGDRLMLKVVLTENNPQTIEEMILERGRMGKIRRCY